MNDDRWIPIRCRAFRDVPRESCLRWHGVDLVLVSWFDEALDDDPPDYRILRVTELPPDAGSWLSSIADGVEMGRIPAASVKFDETCREIIERSSVEPVFAALLDSPRTA